MLDRGERPEVASGQKIQISFDDVFAAGAIEIQRIRQNSVGQRGRDIGRNGFAQKQNGARQDDACRAALGIQNPQIGRGFRIRRVLVDHDRGPFVFWKRIVLKTRLGIDKRITLSGKVARTAVTSGELR